MTYSRILELAADMALQQWAEAREKLSERPDSMIWKTREEKAWREYSEINAERKRMNAEDAE